MPLKDAKMTRSANAVAIETAMMDAIILPPHFRIVKTYHSLARKYMQGREFEQLRSV